MHSGLDAEQRSSLELGHTPCESPPCSLQYQHMREGSGMLSYAGIILSMSGARENQE